MKHRVALGIAAVVLLALVGLAFAFVRLDLPREVLIAKYADANSHFVTLSDGSRAHVEITGPANAPTVVLLHGAMASVQSWRGWTPILAAKYRVVAIDLPGNGLTGAVVSGDYSRAGMVAFVHSVLQALGVSHEAIAGHSMGGGVAVEYAERHPSEVWGLVLVDAAGLPTPGKPPTASAKMAQNPITRVLFPWIMPRGMLAKGLRATYGDPSKLTDARIDEIAELERFPGNRRGLIGHYLAPNDDDAVQAGLGRITAPTLVEWGGVDRVQPITSAHTFVQQIPSARLIVYPGIGHLLIEEAPGPSATDALSFLDGVQRPSWHKTRS